MLSGTAVSAISGFSLSATFYEAGVSLLKERFANPQAIIASYLEQLLKIRRVTDGNYTKQMRSVYDSVEANIRSLKNLGIESAQYGSLLLPVMLSKLTNELQLLISRRFDKNLWYFDAFFEAFRGELEARERFLAIGITSQEPVHARKPYQANKKPFPPTAATLMSSQNAANCTLCKGRHSTANCGIVADFNERNEILRNEGACFTCLEKNHLPRECPFKIKCFECGRRHHVSVCEAQKPALPKNPLAATNLYPSTRGNKLLQTACSEVSNPKSSAPSLKTRITLDRRNQRNHVQGIN